MGHAWAVSGESSLGSFRWGGQFANEVAADVGLYPVTLKVTDIAGHETFTSGYIEVTWQNLVYLELVPGKPEVKAPKPNNPSGYYSNPAIANTEAPGIVLPATEAASLPPVEPQPEIAPVPSGSNPFAGMSVQTSFSAGNQTVPSPTSNLPSSTVLWGGAASALLGATLAEWQRRREEEAARLAAMRNGGGGDEEEGEGNGRKSAGQIAYEKKQQHKRIVAESQALMNQRKAQENAMKDYRAGERNAAAIAQSYEAREAVQVHRAGERDAVSVAEDYKAREQEKQNAVDEARWVRVASVTQGKLSEEVKPTTWTNTIAWIDNNQAVASIGVGTIIGLATIAIALAVVGSITLPVLLLAAGIAAVVAGAAVAAGTAGINTYHGRPATTNIWENMKKAAATAVLVSGIGLFVAGGLLTQTTIAAGNAIAGVCMANPAVCANAGTVLNVIDMLEQAALTTQLAIETTTGNPHAGETAIELQLEQMDGGTPGNTLAREIGGKISHLSDEALELAMAQGPDAIRALSRWDADLLEEYGVELIERSSRDANALRALDELMKMEDLSGSEAQSLINEIAQNSIQGSGDRFVIGKWVSHTEGFVDDARKNGGMYYESHPDIMYELIEVYGKDDPRTATILWGINQRAIQMQIASGVDFDYSLNGVIDVDVELRAIEAARIGNWEKAINLVGGDKARLHEAEMLFNAGYTYTIDRATNRLHWVKP